MLGFSRSEGHAEGIGALGDGITYGSTSSADLSRSRRHDSACGRRRPVRPRSGATLSAMEGYPFVVPIQVRWRDLDALAHVNNAAVITYVETARTVLWRERFGGGPQIPFVVARVEVVFRKQITLDDTVLVGLRVTDLRGARFAFEYRIESDGELAAEAVTVMAHVRPGEARPTRIPIDLRQRLADLVTDGR